MLNMMIIVNKEENTPDCWNIYVGQGRFDFVVISRKKKGDW